MTTPRVLAFAVAISTLACGASDASPTADVDANGSDAPLDASIDAPIDAPTDTRFDAPSDTARDALADTALDGDATSPPATLPETFFGMDLNSLPSAATFPTAKFGTVRLWDSQTSWAALQPTATTFDWTRLDARLDLAEAHGLEVIYTFGHVPTWASSNPTDASKTCATASTGDCYPPTDLAADGTGTDATFKAFVAALVAHAGKRIHVWEPWNEFNNTLFWAGTAQQLVRMAKDARDAIVAADPKAIVLTPSSCGCWNAPLTGIKTTNAWDGMAFYLKTTVGTTSGADLADAIAFHPYPGSKTPVPEVLDTITQHMIAISGGKPLWDSESGWGKNTYLLVGGVAGTCDAPPFSAACDAVMSQFVARSEVIAAFDRLVRRVWYSPDIPTYGALWDRSTGAPYASGRAYMAVHDWLVGATLDKCTVTGTVWSCALTRGATSEAIVWDTAGASTIPTASWTTMHALDGTTTSPPPSPIPIGLAPILVEHG